MGKYGPEKTLYLDFFHAELNWERINLKDGNKKPFKDLKIYQTVKGKLKKSMVLPVECIKFQSNCAN